MSLAPRLRRALLAALALTALAPGCGGDDDRATTASGSRTATAPAAHVVPQADVNRVPLGTPEKLVLRRFGEPVGRPSNESQSCLVYATDAGPDTWQRFCFVDGKLANAATVIGRRNALTLEPKPLEGPGKLHRPNVGKKDE